MVEPGTVSPPRYLDGVALSKYQRGPHCANLLHLGLARDLGASTIKMTPFLVQADQSDLVQNIHLALQTKALVATVRTSSNYMILTAAMTLATFLMMVAAWISLFWKAAC
jgi:hypothetical protein